MVLLTEEMEKGSNKVLEDDYYQDLVKRYERVRIEAQKAKSEEVKLWEEILKYENEKFGYHS